MRCSACGRESAAGARFCDACGEPLKGNVVNARQCRDLLAALTSGVAI